jgi:hypothetical protein
MKRAATPAILAALMLLAVAVIAKAQPKKAPRIGYLTGSSISVITDRTEAFRQGFCELGYWRGRTLSLSGDLQRENSIASRLSRPS